MISPEDQLKEMLACQRLKTEQRNRIVDRRCRVVFGVVMGIAAFIAVMVTFGISRYGFWGSGPDMRWTDRICLFAGEMVPGGMFVWAMGKFRVIQSQLFLNPKPLRWLPLIAGLAGCVIFTCALREWLDKPFSGETLRSNDAWKFGVAWALLGWAYVFRR